MVTGVVELVAREFTHARAERAALHARNLDQANPTSESSRTPAGDLPIVQREVGITPLESGARSDLGPSRPGCFGFPRPCLRPGVLGRPIRVVQRRELDLPDGRTQVKRAPRPCATDKRW